MAEGNPNYRDFVRAVWAVNQIPIGGVKDDTRFQQFVSRIAQFDQPGNPHYFQASEERFARYAAGMETPEDSWFITMFASAMATTTDIEFRAPLEDEDVDLGRELVHADLARRRGESIPLSATSQRRYASLMERAYGTQQVERALLQ